VSVSSARNSPITEEEVGTPPAAQRVLVIVPAYNEAPSLPALISRLRASCPSFDVLVVNDGSTDQTKPIVFKLPVRLISLSCNLGVGGAMQTGLMVPLQDNYDVAIQVDGDGQHPPEQIARKWWRHGARLAVSKRGRL
jgi:glycosyltransferase involved in cell wall biosynthesis